MTNSNKYIDIKGARVHNLKNINVKIPHNKIVVITGLSGSGKSSLAFSTLFAEGQRRYVESLSSYARQFLGRLEKPDVDHIKGISPAVAIEQKVISNNPRSTVGTVTEIYDYLKVLYARIGKTYSPTTGLEIKKHTVADVVDYIRHIPVSTKFMILAPWLVPEGRSVNESIKLLISQGYSKVLVNETTYDLTDFDSTVYQPNMAFVIIDRLRAQTEDEDYLSRIGDSVQTGFYEGFGEVYIFHMDSGDKTLFSNKFEADGIEFIEPSINFFTFNNPFGACKTCEGFGSMIGIDENLVIPDRSLSLMQDAVVPWRGEKMSQWKMRVIHAAEKVNFPIHSAIEDLSAEQYNMLWQGTAHFEGLWDFFNHLQEQSYKIHYRIMLSRYRGKTKCTDCRGTRLRIETNNVKIDGKNLSDLLLMPISDLLPHFENISLDVYQKQIANRLLLEIKNRLTYLIKVGLGYLTLNRQSGTLSGGESQRIHLANALGSSLVGSMYILDEPSIGLHPRDTAQLIEVLKHLKAIGNSVIIVEHEEDIISAADEIIDMGPMAGSHGGEVVFQGNHQALVKAKNSITADYLTGRKEIATPKYRRLLTDKITIEGAKENNLKNITVSIPLNGFVCVTGVSGSGKSTLIKQILAPALQKKLGKSSTKIGKHSRLTGDIQKLKDIELIDQNAIGRSSRSNPATYVKAFDYIRDLFSKQQASKILGAKPGYFSYNVPGGRCETCKGEGEITISMQFMADVKLICEDCKGMRYKPEALDIEVKGKNIADVLNLTIDEALLFFKGAKGSEKSIRERLQPLQDLGLGYLKLGQSSSTLSGGEAQRIKLATYLMEGQKNVSPTLFLFDEPTTGLHFHDIAKLLVAFNQLIALGHSILVIEHNMDVVKTADWVIDIGPEGGEAGGNVVFEGTPEELLNCAQSYTGKYLQEKLNELV
ncbi:MAG: excinuclease ABC subunit UvrA [Putridiphycobacter sp.]|nr:excinuclease ABC subunit UvrA [Putridiphycobacter sp.]